MEQLVQELGKQIGELTVENTYLRLLLTEARARETAPAPAPAGGEAETDLLHDEK